MDFNLNRCQRIQECLECMDVRSNIYFFINIHSNIGRRSNSNFDKFINLDKFTIIQHAININDCRDISQINITQFEKY